jgi:hypothetical protein
MSRYLTLIAVVATLSFSFTARADGQKCPPGAWFCAEAEVDTAPAAKAPQIHPEKPVATRSVLGELFALLTGFGAG